MDKALEQLVEAVKQASPAMWAAAQAKVQADMTVSFWLIWVGLAVLVGCVGLVVWDALVWNEGLAAALGIVCGIGALLFAVINWSIYTGMRLAPEWYAIKALAELSPLT